MYADTSTGTLVNAGNYEDGRMNIWDGNFPSENILTDGYFGKSRRCSFSAYFCTDELDTVAGVAPVLSYQPQTPSGLHSMLGNVWEWVVTAKKPKSKRSSSINSKEEEKEEEKEKSSDQRVLRGGSFIDSLV